MCMFASCTNEYSDAVSSKQRIFLNIEGYKFPEMGSTELETRTTKIYKNGYNADDISQSTCSHEKDSHRDDWEPRWDFETYESFYMYYRDVWVVGDEIGIFAGSHHDQTAKMITVSSEDFNAPESDNNNQLYYDYNPVENTPDYYDPEIVIEGEQSPIIYLDRNLGDFTLYEGEKYFMFYPYSESKPTELPFDISGQIQKGNDNIDHLKGEHNYLCTMKRSEGREDSPFYSVFTNQTLITGVSHPTSIIRFSFGKLPKEFKGKSVTMTCIDGGVPKPVFTETGTLDAYNNGTITGELKSSISIELRDENDNVGMPVDKNGVLFVHMQVAPADVANCILEITLEGTNGIKYQIYRVLNISRWEEDKIEIKTDVFKAGWFYNFNCWTRDYFTDLNPAYEEHMKDNEAWSGLLNTWETDGCSKCFDYPHISSMHHFLRPSTEYTNITETR